MARATKAGATPVTAVKGSDTKAATPPEVEAPKGVRVQAVFNRMRNPHTGAVFTKNKSVDVLDLDSKDNTWTRSQLRAGVLKIV